MFGNRKFGVTGRLFFYTRLGGQTILFRKRLLAGFRNKRTIQPAVVISMNVGVSYVIETMMY